jgi:ACS family glucarate transporter-like MFS transporter
MWVQYVFATWAPLLLMEAGVRELGRAGLFASLQGLAGVAGLLTGGWLADRAYRAGVGRRAVVVGLLGALGATTLALAVVVQHAPGVGWLTGLLFVVAFAAWGVWGPSFALLGAVASGRELSTAFGLYNTVCVLGAVVGPALTGWTRDLTGSFAAGAYLCAAVAFAGAVFMRFTRGRA